MTPQLEELACLYVLDQLDPGERAAFETRLAGDDDLAGLVRELETTLAQRIRLLPVHHPRADLLPRIEAQLDLPTSSPVGRGLSPPPSPAPRPLSPTLPFWPSFARWSLGAAAAIVLGAGTFFFLDRQRVASPRPIVLVVGLNPQSSTVTELALPRHETDTDGRFVQLASLAEQFWSRPENLPQPSTESATGRHAYALFDPDSRQGFIAVQQLPTRPDGKRYHLWIVDVASGHALDAGVLPSSPPRGLYFFSVDPAEAAAGKLNFLITAEDASRPSPPRPRGEVILGQRPI